MPVTSLLNTHIKSAVDLENRWRALVEGTTIITGSTDRISLAANNEAVIQSIFQQVTCLNLVIDLSTKLIVFDIHDQASLSGKATTDGTDLIRWIDQHHVPKIISDMSQENWPDLVRQAQISPARSALLVPETIDTRHLVLTLIFSTMGFNNEDMDLGRALTRHIGIAFTRMLEYENTLHNIYQKSQHLEEELELAGEIQRALLPRSIPRVAGLSMSLISEPSREIGGDFYDMFTFADKYLGVAVGDVVGKGIPGAITMASLYTAFHEYATDPLMIPTEVMLRANEMLLDATASDRYATLFYGVLSLRDGQFQYCNAGHPPPLICRKNGDVEYLSTGGLILGSFPHARYENGKANLNEGDILVLYTDGVTETTDNDDHVFGFSRLEKTVIQCKDLDVEGIKNGLTDSLRQFTENFIVQDDITVIIMKCEQPFN